MYGATTASGESFKMPFEAYREALIASIVG